MIGRVKAGSLSTFWKRITPCAHIGLGYHFQWLQVRVRSIDDVLIDTPTMMVRAFDYDAGSGCEISGERTVVKIPRGMAAPMA